jgi:hypothetical protein
MRTIRFARRRRLEGETKSAESFPMPGWRLPGIHPARTALSG